jgi:hypothetical protein
MAMAAHKPPTDSSWFAERVARGQKEIFQEVITITPDIARRLLETNENNRPILRRTLRAMVHDILNGRWELNGESIIISKEGLLNDGQHRLEAVVEADTPIQSLVVFGVTRESRKTVDTGRSRKISDFLIMDGVSSASYAGTVAKLHYLYRTKKSPSVGATTADIQAEYWAHSKHIDDAITRWTHGWATEVHAKSAVAAAHVIIRQVADFGLVEQFFDSLKDGARLERDDPILWCREKLNNIARTRDKVMLRAEYKLEVILRYWNAWANEKKTKKHLPILGEFPRVDPGSRPT